MYSSSKKMLSRVFKGLPKMLVGFLKDRVAVLPSNTVVDNLNVYGLHIFEERLTIDDVQQLNHELDMLFEKFPPLQHGQANNRVSSVGLVSEILRPYSDSVMPFIKQYLNTDDIQIEISYFQKSYPETDFDNVVGGDFHVDDNKANLKYFIYLTDVTSANGPFSALLGTSKWKLKWSFFRGLLWAITEKRDFLYGFLLDRQFCLDNETKIIGEAGTHFLVDTTAVHRACQLEKDERRVVVVSFNRC